MMISARRLAKRWDFCPQTIYNRIKDGRLPFVKVGNSKRIPMEAVEEIEASWRAEQGASGSSGGQASGSSAGPQLVASTPGAAGPATAKKPSALPKNLSMSWRDRNNRRSQR